jgi:hypothetical protein
MTTLGTREENVMITLKFAKHATISSCILATVLLLAAHTIAAQVTIRGVTISKPNGPGSRTPGDTDVGTPQDVATNPNAPQDYDANLNVNDSAIATDRFRDVQTVRILAKSGAAYKVAYINRPDAIRWYSANSVYPYFDQQVFNQIMYDYKRYAEPYLSCYGKKHNLEEERVTRSGYNAFGSRHFSNAQEAQQALQAGQPKLAELESLLKSKLGGGAPNTFLDYEENPAIIAEIATQREEYLRCAVGTVQDEPSPILPVFLEDIQKAKREAENYVPGHSLYLVSAGAASEALLRAVSPKAREAWSAKWLKDPASRAQFDAAWDDLAAVAAKKLPFYKPNPSGFQFSYPDGEKLLMNYFKNPSALKIFRIGTGSAGWEIQKDNSGLLPIYRYKTVRVYLRDSNNDHPYCRVVSARVKQDYAGGGTFKAETYRSSVSGEIYGCP